MRYPVFHIKDKFSYVFVPQKPISDTMLEQLEELWTLCTAKYKYTYVLIGTTDCIVVTKEDVDEKAPLSFDNELPDVCDLVVFPDDDDASECEIDYNKKPKAKFKARLVDILNSVANKEIKIHVLSMKD